MKKINAKGKAWPNPMTMVKTEVDRGEAELEVLLDNPISASNIMNFLDSRGFGVQLKDDEGTITISARKKEQPPKAAAFKQPAPVNEAMPAAQSQAGPLPFPTPKASGAFSVLITREVLGHDRELGEALMKSFLAALPKMENPPPAVALMNEGVKLALYYSSSCDHLKNLEKKGVSVLVSGMCVNYFNITDQIGAGSISNMPEIIETLNKAGKMMTI